MTLDVRILTPCANLADKKRIEPLFKLLAPLGYKCQVVMGCYVDENRNELISGANQYKNQKHPPGITGFIDSDIQCTPSDVAAAVETVSPQTGVYIVGVPYETQHRNGLDCCGNKINSRSGLVEVPFTGGGMLFFDNIVLNTIDYPYFYRPLQWVGECCKPEEDDMYFCQKPKKPVLRYMQTMISG